MPQIFQVLKCYKCFVFQIHQTKKSNKFECKMCGEKQSIKRYYGIGTAKDCRLHVQRLNSLRGEIDAHSSIPNDSDTDHELEDFKTNKETSENRKYLTNKALKRSKWSEYLDRTEDTDTVNDEPMFLGDSEVLLELPQKRKVKKFKVKTNTINNLETPMSSQINLNLNYKELDSNSEDKYEHKNFFKAVPKSDHNMNNNKKQNQLKMIDSNQKQSPTKHNIVKSVNKDSKWAQFVEENYEDNEDIEENISPTCEPDHRLPNSEKFFSLCDDTDLDSILDI